MTVLHVPACSGVGFRLSVGALVKVVDTEGGQVADVVCVSAEDAEESLSNGRTFDMGRTLRPGVGQVLYSSLCRPMLTIVDDPVGRHDFLFGACSPEMFRVQYGVTGGHPSCVENLARALAECGAPNVAIPTPFNVFMNVELGPDGKLEIRDPLSKPGDALTLRAEMDLVVAVAACSASGCNQGRCTSIDVEVTH